MPLYSYKCDYCGRVEEKILPINRREEKFSCNAQLESHEMNDFSIISQKGYSPIEGGKVEYRKCKGEMIFQPVQKTTFRMTGFEKE